MKDKILEVKNISKKFIKSLDKTTKFINLLGGSYKEEVVHAVDNVSFDILSGEVVGVVGGVRMWKIYFGKNDSRHYAHHFR